VQQVGAFAVSEYDGLRQYCTVRQLEVIEAVEREGSIRKAARTLGISHRNVFGTLEAIRKKAAMQGHSPAHDMTRTVPEPYVVKGVSTYYGKDGKPSGQWVKSTLDEQKRIEVMRAAIEAMKDEIPRSSITPAPTRPLASALCNCYIITDYHLSMLSHHEETGADWDMKIAEQTLVEWFRQAIAQAPDAEQGVFAQLSDLLHADGIEPLTPASKHLLDVDSRFYKVVRVVIRLIRQIIGMLLDKHARVHVVMADANHDPVSQIWLREWLAILYENEPRITVDRSPSPYNAFEFGKTALFFHHGHKRKVADVSDVFAGMFRELFGRTKYAYAHLGHRHSLEVKETNLMVVEQHRTLAARDAYAARGGWLAGRDAKVITYHREFGEVGRLTINSDMLKA
jgi:hypothetical protein